LTHLLITVDKFTKWAKAKRVDLLIAVDKFTKWAISSKQAVDFIQDSIFHFGVPNSIITNNGTQFTEEKFLDFCDDNNIYVD
jgi:hypothetical protein